MIIKVCESSAGCRVVADATPMAQTGGGVLAPQAEVTDAYMYELTEPASGRPPRLGNPILLAQAPSNEGIKIVPGSREDYAEDGWAATLAADQKIQGVKFAKGATVKFDEGGKLKK